MPAYSGNTCEIITLFPMGIECYVIDKNKFFTEFLNTKPNTAERITPITIKKWIDRYCDFYHIETNHYKSNGNVFVELNISSLVNNNDRSII